MGYIRPGFMVPLSFVAILSSCRPGEPTGRPDGDGGSDGAPSDASGEGNPVDAAPTDGAPSDAQAMDGSASDSALHGDGQVPWDGSEPDSDGPVDDGGAADADLTSGLRCLMPLGDSITQADSSHVSYRYWLWKALQDTDYDVDFVGSLQVHANNRVATYPDNNFDRDHEGHWGWEANEVRDALPDWLEGYTPGVVLMHLGTNDANRSHPTTGPGGTIGELEDIVGLLRADNPKVVILLAQIIPLNADASDAAQGRIQDLNDAIATLVPTIDQPDSPVIVVDQFTGYDATDLNYDRFHPNEQGERRMANVWLEALLPQLAAGRGRCPE